ncbi:GyrI-like domain-containing protein [Paenibacillus silagei]|uniref:Transcriptional regulator YdeE n=1 Tax=Paenibacillus silagei TaxID=1670801 RepID=A0ABS4NKL3_9BACL|nr:GyrI-like domain-containing protein [Paenibacillus silagei]MBP2110600.1 putative transcriptional regulator YdeE [Paenibacillus silagei]
MEAKVITLPAFYVVGYQVEADVAAFESGLGKQTYQTLTAGRDQLLNKLNDHVILMQLYPLTPEFDPQADRFVHMLGYAVSHPDEIPLDMVSHAVPESRYVTYTHKGLESEISRSYDYLYNEIEMFIALK